MIKSVNPECHTYELDAEEINIVGGVLCRKSGVMTDGQALREKLRNPS